MIYFDYAATSPLLDEVAQTLHKLNLSQFANSESSYDLGVKVHQQLEKSRALLADFFACKAEDLIFTSGASEANSMAIKSIALANQAKGKHIITSEIEHASILNACQQLQQYFGYEVTYLKVNRSGLIDYQELQNQLRPDTCLVSIMHINNEIGSIHDLKIISQLVRQHSKAFLHSDCVQSVAKYPIDLSLLDAASFSAHKLGGLKGSGLLYCRSHIELLPLINGGAQEFHKRGGTLNANAYILFAKTMRIAHKLYQDNHQRVMNLRNSFIQQLLELDDTIVVHSPSENGSAYIVSFSYPSYPSEMIFNHLQTKQIYVSYRSTCHSREKRYSHVLSALGCSVDEMESVIRVSFDYSVTQEQIQQFIEILKGLKRYGKSK